ncbi:MAG: hypothetical protein KJ000_19320 [Pirellulaceae bacterium]|nr:hypothetical protein [Pirellulaceae bacterium]
MRREPGKPLANRVDRSYGEHPTCVWNNTLNGRVGRLVSSSPRIQDGVDFFNGTPKPGYTPYAYPHPLVSEQPASGVNP